MKPLSYLFGVLLYASGPDGSCTPLGIPDISAVLRDHADANSTEAHLEFGVFADGFVSSLQNHDKWAAHWVGTTTSGYYGSSSVLLEWSAEFLVATNDLIQWASPSTFG